MAILRYLIIREWVASFLKSAFALYLLTTNANIVSELLRSAAPFKDILLHHLLESPKWILKILPIACLMATLFGLNNMKKRNELVPIFASGFPRKTFVLTILQLSMVVAIIHWIIGGHLAPFAKSIRHTIMQGQEIHFRSNRAQGVHTTAKESGKLWYIGENYFSSFSVFDKKNKQLREISLFYVDPKQQLPTKIINAERAVHLQDYRWSFRKGNILKNLGDQQFSTNEVFKVMDITLSEKPDDFKYLEYDIYKLSFNMLYRYIVSIQKLGIPAHEYLLEFYQIISSATLCILFAMTPIFSIFTPSRRSSSFGKNVAFVFIFIIVFWLLYSICISLGAKGTLPPVIAVFLMPVLQATFIIANLTKHRKLQ